MINVGGGSANGNHSKGFGYGTVNKITASSSTISDVELTPERNSTEAKTVNALVKALDSRSFNYGAFAYLLEQKAGPDGNAVMMKLVDCWLDQVVSRYIAGAHRNAQEEATGVLAHRVLEALQIYKP